MKQQPHLLGGTFLTGSLALGLALAPAARADVIELTSIADTQIYNTGPNDSSKGVSSFIDVGSDSASENQRTLLRFDLSSLPQNMQVTEATLTLRQAVVTDGNGDEEVQVSVYRLLKDWNEGGATWNSNMDGISTWSSPGADDTSPPDADRAAAASDTFDVFGGTAFNDWDVTADVQAMVSGSAENDGWILILPNAAATDDRFRFYTKEDTDPNRRPQLTVTLVPEPGTAMLGAAGAMFMLLGRRRRGGSR